MLSSSEAQAGLCKPCSFAPRGICRSGDVPWLPQTVSERGKSASGCPGGLTSLEELRSVELFFFFPGRTVGDKDHRVDHEPPFKVLSIFVLGDTFQGSRTPETTRNSRIALKNILPIRVLSLESLLAPSDRDPGLGTLRQWNSLRSLRRPPSVGTPSLHDATVPNHVGRSAPLPGL